ncbi:MAG: DUF4367 domain-containing protein [Butyricicoccus sp.]|nr:DUF4367 domain-containing protein [Butyricicoccus sp.]
MTDIDRLLYECAEAGAEQWIETIPADDFCPSLRFRLKMRRLLKRRRTADLPVSYRPRLRRAAIVCVMLLISMQLMGVISLGAIYERFIEIITTAQTELTEFVYSGSGGEDDLFVPLVPGYLPEGMEETRREENKTNHYVRYEDADGNYVSIRQKYFTKKTVSTLILDTEDAHTETYLLNEYEVFYVEKGERRTLLYMDGNTRLLIEGNVTKTELKKVALSTK